MTAGAMISALQKNCPSALFPPCIRFHPPRPVQAVCSYDYTVSVPALEAFEKKYGYSMSAEDFINKGNLHVTHMPGDEHKKAGSTGIRCSLSQ